MKYLLLLLTLSLPATSGTIVPKQVCLPTSLLKKMVEEEMSKRSIIQRSKAHKELQTACATKGFVLIKIDNEILRINCTPNKQV